jgi:hypothetical protein
MTLALAGIAGWLLVLIVAISLGAAAKRGDELAETAFDRHRARERSAVPSQNGTRPADCVGTVQRFSRPVAERCELCGAQR